MNPVLELKNGEFLSDAIAIGQYLGDELGLAPDDPFDRARAIDAAECFMSNMNGAFEYLRNIPGELPKYWQEERVRSTNQSHHIYIFLISLGFQQDRFEKFLWSMVLPRIHQLDSWLGESQQNGYIPGFIFGAKACATRVSS